MNKKFVQKQVYVGPIAHLRGKSALLKPWNGGIRAQFDDTDLTRSGKPYRPKQELRFEPHARFPTYQDVETEMPDPDLLGYGWHDFDVSDFEVRNFEEVVQIN